LNNKPAKIITIEDIGDLLNSWVHLIIRNKIKFSLFFMIGAILGFTYAHFVNKKQYISRLTFVIDKQISNPSEEGLLRYTGVNTSGNPSLKLMNGDNLQIILQSDRIIKESLLSPVKELNGQNLFTILYNKNTFTPATSGYDSLIKTAIRKLKKSHLLVGKLADMGSFYFIEMNHDNELFCYYFPEVLLESLLKFYEIEKSISLKRDIEALQMIVLSIKKEIKSMQMEWNSKKNQARNLVFFEDQILLENIKESTEDLELRLKVNQEILDIALFQHFRKSTFLNIIDQPFLPLAFKGKSRLKYAFLFGFLTFFTTFLVKNRTNNKLS